MPSKPKTPQAVTPGEVQIRDCFSSPRYISELLVPFVPKSTNLVLEPACGKGFMANVLAENFDVIATDLDRGDDFLLLDKVDQDCIITNPPFSIKHFFIQKAIDFDVPFAFLIPFDLSATLIKFMEVYGCEAIVPKRRVDYITPNILDLIWRGQVKKHIEASEHVKFKNWIKIPQELIDRHGPDIKHYEDIRNTPENLLAEYSSSQFHSVWLTRYFDLGKQLTFVDLSIKDKQRIL